MAGSLKFDTWLNDDDTENYKCRAWVNFNGQATVAIRASGNVSSITDNGTGDYTVNFTNAMPDANFSAVATATPSSVTNYVASVSTYTTTSIKIAVDSSSGGNVDLPSINLAIHR